MCAISHSGKPVFVDEVDIIAIAGPGGDGCVSFRREKFIPRGGPNGGDGGDGGSVFICADKSYNMLQHLAGKHHWKAGHGENGMGKDRHGRNGKSVHIRVPPGTIVRDSNHGIVLKDLAEDGDEICVAVGGRGGRGNTHFKSSTNQTPRESEQGEPAQQRTLQLELKLIADAGLLGKPNAGKSTLLSHLSSARPKIAAYPFTTLTPHLGIVELSRYRRFVMADIPGLIEGAHQGAGLGDAFLRHVERTRLLVHIVDICPPTGDAVDDYYAIRRELHHHSPDLADKREIVVANKMDLTDSQEHLQRFQEALGVGVIPISAVTGRGLEQLVETIWRLLDIPE